MRRLAAISFGLLAPVLLGSQTPRPAPARDALAAEFEIFADMYGSRLVSAFDSIPAAKYGYAPTALQQSVGYIAQHLEAANYWLCGKFSDLKHSSSAKDAAPDTVKARWPKDTLVARLEASMRFCDSALARTPRVNSAQLASDLLAFDTDLAEHYSQLSSYMRMLGLVPPSALSPTRHTAIELASSALREFVGRYEVAEGVKLDVTLRDGSLWVQSDDGAPPVRLSPESNSVFFANGIDAQVTFNRDSRGAVTGLVVHRFNRDRIARKIP